MKHLQRNMKSKPGKHNMGQDLLKKKNKLVKKNRQFSLPGSDIAKFDLSMDEDSEDH